VALDAGPAWYLSNVGAALELGAAVEDVQNVLVAVAPIVGTARVVSVAISIAEAFGFAVAP
jgi:4-carboxymuconolactone decarboxylase